MLDRLTWEVATSGTTGEPKVVGHTLEALTRTVKDRPDLRWGLLYDPTRMAGLQVILQVAFGAGVLIVPPEGTVDERLAYLSEHDCNALSATPTTWRMILASAADLDLKQVTMGGEIADGPTLKAVQGRWPEAHVVHIYATTEDGAVFTVRDGKPGFPADYLDRDDLSVSEGELHVDGRPTGDLVERDGDRYRFVGRSDGGITIGGATVYPETVERAALSAEGVRAAAAVGRESAFTGHLVHLYVEGEDVALDGAFDDLPREARPAKVDVVDRLPRTTTGKVARSKL